MIDVLCDPESQKIRHPGLRALFDYWSERCGAGRLPARRDIDPVDIPDLLPHLMLIDVVSPGSSSAAPPPGLRYRLVGTALVKRMGRDTTGQTVMEGHVGIDWEKSLSDYSYVIERRRPCLRHNQGVGKARRTYASQRLLLPLAADGRCVDMILAGVFWNDAG